MRNTSPYGLSHAPGQLDLHVNVPDSNAHVFGVDLTHVIHTNEVEAAKGGGHGGGGGGGGGTTYPSYTSGSSDGSGFNITINFSGTFSQQNHDYFVAAADQLTAIIAGDLPNVSVRSRGTVTNVDDIVITAELGAIDGSGGILGQAGPTSLRTGSYLPATATMQFDIADVTDLGTAFADVVLHEMSHSLGFGSIWDRLGLVTNGEFTGANALQQYHDVMHQTGNIPVEQDGGSGTAGSHWDEETFGNELMTGYLNDGANYFTGMSAASFADLGYQLHSDYLQHVDQGYNLFG